jgi:hypothetical protein
VFDPDQPTEYTRDGFYLPNEKRSLLSMFEDHELRNQAVTAIIELGLREERPVFIEAIEMTHGCMVTAQQVAPDEGQPDNEQVMFVMAFIAAVIEKFRQSFPNQEATCLIPGTMREGPEEGKLSSMMVVALGDVNSKILWRHSRAAHDEITHWASETGLGHMDHTAEVGGDGLVDPNELWDELDEQCGYFGYNLDELPVYGGSDD